MSSRQPLVVVCAVISNGEGILVTQRPEGGSFAGLWEFPGGKPEAGETYEEALIRECREEIAVDIVVRSHLTRVAYADTDIDVVLEIFFCELAPGAAPACREVADFAWVPLTRLGDYRWPPANGALIARLATYELADLALHGLPER